MKLCSEIISAMVAAGITAEQIAAVSKTLDASQKAARKARNQRYRETNKTSQTSHETHEASYNETHRASYETNETHKTSQKPTKRDASRVLRDAQDVSCVSQNHTLASPLPNGSPPPIDSNNSYPPHSFTLTPPHPDITNAHAKKPEQKTKLATRITETTQPTEADRRFAEQAGMTSIDCRKHWQEFRDHHLAKGSKFLSWQAAWRIWVGRIDTYAPQPRASPQRRSNGLRAIAEMVMRENAEDEEQERIKNGSGNSSINNSGASETSTDDDVFSFPALRR